MTFQEFRKKIRQDNVMDRVLFSGISILSILTGLFLFITTIAKGEPYKTHQLNYYLGYFMLVAMGTASLLRLKYRYKIITVPNNGSMEEKEALIQQIIRSMTSKSPVNKKNFYYFNFYKGFLSGSFQVYIFYDEESVSFSLQKWGHQGFFNFGETGMMRIKLRENLERN